MTNDNHYCEQLEKCIANLHANDKTRLANLDNLIMKAAKHLAEISEMPETEKIRAEGSRVAELVMMRELLNRELAHLDNELTLYGITFDQENTSPDVKFSVGVRLDRMLDGIIIRIEKDQDPKSEADAMLVSVAENALKSIKSNVLGALALLAVQISEEIDNAH